MLKQFDEGVWLDTQPVRIVGMELTVTMTVLRLPDRSLLLYSPIRMTEERRDAVAALGPVAHVYAPNLFHHAHVGEWASAFPRARVHAPVGLSKKRPDLKIDRLHGEAPPEPAFAGVLDEQPIDGCRLHETVLVHRPSRTLIVADLVHNVGRPPAPWATFYTKAMGFYDRVALSRMIRWTAFSNRRAARQSVDRMLELAFDRVIVGHGAPVLANAKDVLSEALAWLPRAHRACAAQ